MCWFAHQSLHVCHVVHINNHQLNPFNSIYTKAYYSFDLPLTCLAANSTAAAYPNTPIPQTTASAEVQSFSIPRPEMKRNMASFMFVK